MANIKVYDLQSSRYKRGYLVIIRDNFCQFCTKTYVVTPRELPRDSSDEGPQHMVSKRNKKLSLSYHRKLLLSRAVDQSVPDLHSLTLFA